MEVITEEYIDNLLRYGERLTLECKKAKHELPKDLWQTYSSFANTCGGIILLGVVEHRDIQKLPDRFEVQGVENVHKTINDFWNTINSDKVSTNVLVDSNVVSFRYKGHEIVIIEVPQASYHAKPVYVNGNPMKGSYKRNYEGDYHCTEEEIKAMLRDSNDSGNDGTLLDGYTMDDIDPETLKAYRIEFEIHNPDHVWNGIDNKEFLRNLGGITTDRNTKREGLTTAGLLMFGKGLPIRERFDNIRMDYFDLTNLAPGSRWSDRITYDGMWENNLYNFMKRVLPKLTSDIKKPFKLDGIIRIDDTPVNKAIREALINMIIHADYLIEGVLKIVKKDDGFEFINPGNLKLPVEQIYQGGNSKARNPRLQTMLRLIGYGDNAGSGFPTILNAWHGENWRTPDLYENADLHQVELKLWTVSLMPIACTDYLENLLGENVYRNLDPNEQIILGTAYLEGNVTNSRLQAILKIHPTDIGKLLSGLVMKKMLVSNSRGRWTSYQLNSNFHKQSEQISFQDVSEPSVKLNHTDQAIYEYIKINGMITSKEVLGITKISTVSGASAALNRLINRGLIEMVHQGKNRYYKLKVISE